MYNMLNFIPDDMGEVQQKLFWLKANGYPDATEQEVIEKTILDGVQYGSRTRDAPTPTYISTKSEPEIA